MMEQLPNWPSVVKTAQKKWIGKSSGAEFTFSLASSEPKLQGIRIFTTHPETIYGVSFIGLSTNHPLSLNFAETDSSLREFVSFNPFLHQ